MLVLGGSSEIGAAILYRLAELRPPRALLLGRDSERMREIAEDLTSAGTATADVAHLDADDLEPHAEAIAGAFRRLGRVHVVVRCVGALGAHRGSTPIPTSSLGAERQLRRSGIASVACAAGGFEPRITRARMLVSSLAAERPCSSNAPCGAAKAGLDTLVQGLADSGWRRLTAAMERLGSGLLRHLFAALRQLPRRLYRRLPLRAGQCSLWTWRSPSRSRPRSSAWSPAWRSWPCWAGRASPRVTSGRRRRSLGRRAIGSASPGGSSREAAGSGHRRPAGRRR